MWIPDPDAGLTVDERVVRRLGRGAWYVHWTVPRAAIAVVLLWSVAGFAAWDYLQHLSECDEMARSPEVAMARLRPVPRSPNFDPSEWPLEVGGQIRSFRSLGDPSRYGFEVGQDLRLEFFRGLPVALTDAQGHTLRSSLHPAEQAASDGAMVFVLGAGGVLAAVLAAFARRARALAATR